METKLEPHPIGACYPPLAPEEFANLKARVHANDPTLSPAILFEGKILDGNHYCKACEEEGVSPRVESMDFPDWAAAIQFVIRRNEGRRNLSVDQRSDIAAKLANCEHGQRGPAKKDAPDGASFSPRVTQSQAAKMMGVSRRSVQRAKKRNRPPMAKSPPKPAPPRPPEIKFPSVVETGFPINGTLDEQDAHMAKYGRTPIHAQAVADVLKHSRAAATFTEGIRVVSRPDNTGPEELVKSLEAMLAWVPKKGQSDPNWGTNFAAKAKEHLKLLRDRLPSLINNLNLVLKLLPPEQKQSQTDIRAAVLSKLQGAGFTEETAREAFSNLQDQSGTVEEVIERIIFASSVS